MGEPKDAVVTLVTHIGGHLLVLKKAIIFPKEKLRGDLGWSGTEYQSACPPSQYSITRDI